MKKKHSNSFIKKKSMLYIVIANIKAPKIFFYIQEKL